MKDGKGGEMEGMIRTEGKRSDEDRIEVNKR